MLTFTDKLLPTQPEQTKRFAGDRARLPELIEAVCNGVGTQMTFPDLLLPERAEFADLASPPAVLQFLRLLVATAGARRVLEIGSFVGLSALAMASALPPDGRLVTIDASPEFAALCAKNVARDRRIMSVRGDAAVALAGLLREVAFDLAFVDGGKEHYPLYFAALRESCVRTLVFDDCFFNGDVLNPQPATAKGRGVRSFLAAAAGAEDYDRALLPVGNGVLIMRRR